MLIFVKQRLILLKYDALGYLCGLFHDLVVLSISYMVYCVMMLQNLSQQSDIADLLGGFKPLDPQYICVPLYREFENLFSSTFSLKVLVTVNLFICFTFSLA